LHDALLGKESQQSFRRHGLQGLRVERGCKRLREVTRNVVEARRHVVRMQDRLQLGATHCTPPPSMLSWIHDQKRT
jgi:hypothetical protein